MPSSDYGERHWRGKYSSTVLNRTEMTKLYSGSFALLSQLEKGQATSGRTLPSRQKVKLSQV